MGHEINSQSEPTNREQVMSAPDHVELAANAIWRLFRHDFDPDGDDIQRYLYKELVLILSQLKN